MGYPSSLGQFDCFRGKMVRIHLDNAEVVEGHLYFVASDYLVVLNHHGIVYVPTVHIQSITVIVRRTSGHASRGSRGMGSQGGGIGSQGRRPIPLAPCFHDLLVLLRGRQVHIHRGGTAYVNGVITEVTPTTVVVHTNGSHVDIPIAEIRSVTLPWHSGSGGHRTSGHRHSGKECPRKSNSCHHRTTGSRRSGTLNAAKPSGGWDPFPRRR
ncbi:hypothetical protein B5M42_020400 [Paenibacillus athensensis]|nr:hypothetical protein [Paenibacillus athensensis]MCD1261167.1 hypothetical protein [Paenibacillus athensensis]